MPTCPDGHDDLRPHVENSIEGASCGTCRGIWLPGAIVMAAIGRTPNVADVDPGHHRACPTDGAKLRCVTHRGVTIDVCPKCGGVWLDYGEREHLQATLESGAGWLVVEGLVHLLTAIVP